MDLSPDIGADLWEKLMFGEPLGSTGAVTRVPVDVFRSVPESRAMLLEAMQEIQRISKALGIQLRPEASEISISRLDALPAGSTTSMHRDIVEGRPSEHRSRSEEHTSELQSHLNLVCRLLLEKKKNGIILRFRLQTFHPYRHSLRSTP